MAKFHGQEAMSGLQGWLATWPCHVHHGHWCGALYNPQTAVLASLKLAKTAAGALCTGELCFQVRWWCVGADSGAK